ncbi:MAG: hypothetical protein V1689_05820 [Pseudomonadota bacterium]
MSSKTDREGLFSGPLRFFQDAKVLRKREIHMKGKNSFWDREIETLPHEQILKIQWERIKERLRYLQANSAFYQAKFERAGLKVDRVADLEDFRNLVPFTTKEELQEERERRKDPYAGLLCVPTDDISQLMRTAGTTGVPTIYGLTGNDLDQLGRLTARIWYQIGAKKGDTVAVATMGCWNPFSIALVEGLRASGIRRYHFSMPIAGEEVFPIEILPRWMSVEGIYLSSRPLWQVTEKYGERLRDLLPELRYILMAGQHVTSAFREGIEAIWGGRLFEAYTMTDVCLPASNCNAQTETFHFPEDAFFLEVIDPSTGQDLTGTGKAGEIVVSSLAFEGTPLLRFRSGDIGFTVHGVCPCGRTGTRLGISERMAHSVQVGDRLVFSSEVEEVLYAMPEFFLKHYHLVRRKSQPQENLVLRVVRPSEAASEEEARERLISRIEEALGVGAEIEFISEGDEEFVAQYKFLKVVTE